jgi:hypothetical protein
MMKDFMDSVKIDKVKSIFYCCKIIKGYTRGYTRKKAPTRSLVSA